MELPENAPKEKIGYSYDRIGDTLYIFQEPNLTATITVETFFGILRLIKW